MLDYFLIKMTKGDTTLSKTKTVLIPVIIICAASLATILGVNINNVNTDKAVSAVKEIVKSNPNENFMEDTIKNLTEGKFSNVMSVIPLNLQGLEGKSENSELLKKMYSKIEILDKYETEYGYMYRVRYPVISSLVLKYNKVSDMLANVDKAELAEKDVEVTWKNGMLQINPDMFKVLSFIKDGE